MAQDLMQYGQMVEDSLRGVVRQALKRAATDGLLGEHHFYIAFKTQFPGVVIPDHLGLQYPEEMTIVLQYQYDNLRVDDDALAVTLHFNGKPERLRVPFHAVISFTDPSVNFSLQIKTALESNGSSETDMAVVGNFEIEGTEASPKLEAVQGGDDERSGEVVALDAFRKK